MTGNFTDTTKCWAALTIQGMITNSMATNKPPTDINFNVIKQTQFKVHYNYKKLNPVETH